MRAPLSTSDGRSMTRDEFEDTLTLIERSGVVPVVEGLLLKRTGRPRTLTVKSIFFSLQAVAIQRHHRMHIIEAARVLNSLTDGQRMRLGLNRGWDADQTYDRLDRLFNAIASAVDPANGGVVTAHWIVDALLNASIPADAPRSGSLAVDGTHLETWATMSGDYESVDLDGPAQGTTIEETERPSGLAKSSASRRGPKARVLSVGTDGRNIYTKDVDARGGWRTATNSRLAGKYIGYEVHLVAQVRDVRSHNYSDNIALADEVPSLIRGMAVSPAGSHRAESIVPTLLQLRHDDESLKEIVWDRGYSLCRAETGYFPLRQAGYELVFDLAERQRGQRPFGGRAKLVDGGLFSHHLPDELLGHASGTATQTPLSRPARSTPPFERREMERRFDLRARWRLVRHQGPSDQGTTRWRCPFHGHLLRSRAFPHTMRSHAPLVPMDAAKCCDGIITVEASELPLWQRYPYGTTAWQHAYSRRNLIETVNSALQQQFTGLAKGYHRVFGLTKVTLLLGFTAVGYNRERMQTYRRGQKVIAAQKQRPASRAKRRTGTWQDLVGGAPATTPSPPEEPEDVSPAPP
jgi:hypothetical protein